MSKRKSQAAVLLLSSALLFVPSATVEAGSPCSFLGIPVCCFCFWDVGCATSGPTLLSTTTGREKKAEASANCCASCCPEVPANPQTSKCTVQSTNKYSLSVTGGIEIDPVSVGLEAGWEDETIAGAECSANCTDCNTGRCEGGFNTRTSTYSYVEVCLLNGNSYSATITVVARTSVYCDSTTGACPKSTGTGGH